VAQHAAHVVLRVLDQHAAVAGVRVHLQQPGGVGVHAAHQQHRAVARRPAGQPAPALVRPPRQEHAPGRPDGVAHADFGAAVRGLHLRGAHREPVVGGKAGHVAGVLGVQGQHAGREVGPVHVEQARVALVDGHQQGVGEGGVGGDRLGAGAGERGQVLGPAGGDVGLVQVEVLVAVRVLEVQDVRAVALPEEGPDAALPVVGDHPVIFPPQRPHPHVQHAVRGREVGQLGAVRRDLRAGLFGVAEQHGARDRRRELGQAGGVECHGGSPFGPSSPP
jgi:hypothetical protein